MSGQLVGRVLDGAATRSATALLVLVAIADHARADGAGAWPSVGTLARRTRLSRRSVQRALDELRRSGDLVVDERPRRSHTFTVVVEGVSVTQGDDVTQGDSVTPSGASERRGEGVSVTGEGDTLAPRGDSVTPKPSGNHHVEPSGKRQRAHGARDPRSSSSKTDELRAMGAHRDAAGRWWLFDNATSESRLVHDERGAA